MEKSVERYLKKRVEELGGLCLKLTAPTVGWPDRTILLPTGEAVFVEVKQETGAVTPAQRRQLAELNQLHFRTEVVWNTDDVDKLIHRLREEMW